MSSSLNRTVVSAALDSTSTLLPVKALRALSGSLTSAETILAGDGASLKYETVRMKRPKSHGRSGSADALPASSSPLTPVQCFAQSNFMMQLATLERS